jgi:2-succinyl-5-enolpyruvyl-6-hydroxy-3-cyclohexene-1-carboxylate synthase
MPIRDVDAHTDSPGRVLANRGASGIDGLLSMAFGAAARSSRTIALSGDLSFLHDVSALGSDEVPDLVMVVLDNNGGGLFDLLPQAVHAPAFEKLFIAPHGLDLSSVAAGFGRSAKSAPEDVTEIGAEIESMLEQGGLHVYVVAVDREVETKQRRELDEAAARALDGF